MDLKGSKTEANLLDAFAGESKARNKYDYYAKQAAKEGFQSIGAFFAETALNEQQHAKIWYQYLGGIKDTKENLLDAAEGEHYETTEMYPTFAKIAREEGFTEIAARMELIGKIEAEHEARYRDLLKNVETSAVFKKDEPVAWRCRKCGHIHHGAAAPGMCPACAHPQAYFEVAAFNY